MITAMVCATSLLAAVVVFIPIEVVLAAGGQGAEITAPWLALGAAATHTLGKMAHYWLAAGMIRSQRVRSLLTRWGGKNRAEMWQAWQHSRWFARLGGVSGWLVSWSAAAFSLPPYALMPFIAPGLGQPWWHFASASLAGRWLRFYIVIALPAWAGWVS